MRDYSPWINAMVPSSRCLRPGGHARTQTLSRSKHGVVFSSFPPGKGNVGSPFAQHYRGFSPHKSVYMLSPSG